MLYHAYELQRSFLSSASAIATMGANMLNSPLNPMTFFGGEPIMASALEVFAHASAPYGKPAFGLASVEIDGTPSAVHEEVVLERPFGDLIRFRHEKLAKDAPRLLIVAPMSGHYATLLRGTVARMIPCHEVYITDWADARDVPLKEGRFDLDDYIDYLVGFLEHVGPGAHMLAVC